MPRPLTLATYPAPGPGQTGSPQAAPLRLPPCSLLFRGHKRMQSQAWGTHTRSSPRDPSSGSTPFPEGWWE